MIVFAVSGSGPAVSDHGQIGLERLSDGAMERAAPY
jgi:hypothetical protein